MHLQNIWLDSVIKSGIWDGENMCWTLRVRRGQDEKELTCSYLVFATGTGGAVPVSPQYEDRVCHRIAEWISISHYRLSILTAQQHRFQGVVLHSADYVDCAGWEGKQGVVIGTANTGNEGPPLTV